MTTIQIKYCDIPDYLRVGEFFRNLDSEDPEGTIEVPADCFHPQGETAADLEEFRQLLRVMVFWVLDDIPLGVLNFCKKNGVETWIKGIADLPGSLKQDVQPLLLTAYSKPTRIPFGDIIETGRWDLIMHAVSRIPKNSPATRIAAQYGNLRLLQYLHEDGFNWHGDTCAFVSFGGHLECLRYLHENGCPWDVQVYFCAVQNGNLSCMKYAHENGLEWHVDVCKEVAMCGQLSCLQYAHDNGCPWDNMTTKCAAQEGHVDCLRFAHENGCSWNTEIYFTAAKNGHVNCIQYAFSQGLEWHVGVCKEAALKGHLDCLQFAHENGCPWTSKTTECAAQNGHVHCLMYALEHGCPVEVAASELACRNGHFECLQLLHQFGAPWDEGVALHAAMCPTVDCLRYLHENGCPWNEKTPHQAARKGRIEPLRYALEHGCPHNEDIVRWAVHCNSLDCLRYLVENQVLHVNISVFLVALLRGDIACLQYLLDQGCPYVDAKFADNEKQWVIFDAIFRTNNSEFIQCVVYAVERGWVPCRNFIQYIVTRDEPCKQWLISEGHYSEGGDGDDLRVGASSDLCETSRVVARSDASGAVKSRHKYCVVM